MQKQTVKKQLGSICTSKNFYSICSGLFEFACSESREYYYEPFQTKALACLTAKTDPSLSFLLLITASIMNQIKQYTAIWDQFCDPKTQIFGSASFLFGLFFNTGRLNNSNKKQVASIFLFSKSFF